MVDALERLVSAESPSNDPALIEECAALVNALGADATGVGADVIRVDGRPHLRWQFGGPSRVVAVGHFDTVWPAGTLARWPFARHGDRATGPGIFDMKAGIVQLFEAVATLDDLDGLTILLTSDEEVGSKTSRGLIEDAARGAEAALVFEASAGGALKIARKGTGMYTLHIGGVASHAGLEPEKGSNALIEAAHLVLALGSLGRPELGTTVTPTMASAGSASNVVPAHATVEIDVRVSIPEEAGRVDAAIRALATTVPGTVLEVDGGPTRPPLPAAASAGLMAAARQSAAELGLGPIEGVAVGGASDGNFTAAVGTPTLDGLGAVGDGAHAEGEYLIMDAMASRAALAGQLLAGLLAGRYSAVAAGTA
jgi:glutamate carboxypeptidase